MGIKIKATIATTRVINRLNKLQSRIATEPEKQIIKALEAKVLPAVRKRLVEGRHIFKKILYDSIEARPIFQFGGDALVEFGYYVPYGLNLELGSAAETPFFAKILQWVQVKNGVTGNEAKRQAYLIHRKLKKEGATPHPVLLPVWTATQDQFFADFIKRLETRLYTRLIEGQQ